MKMLPLEGECTNVEEGLSHEGEIVRYPSVSLSPILSRNEKVEQHIRKKTHKPNALRFWVEGGVIPLSGLTLVSFLFGLLKVSSLGFSQQCQLWKGYISHMLYSNLGKNSLFEA